MATNKRNSQPVNEVIEPTKIKTECPKCGKLREVQGLNWNAIIKHVGDDVATNGMITDKVQEEPIMILCSNCRYREDHKSKPLTETQKQKRAQYNKNRREQIKEALDFMKANKEA